MAVAFRSASSATAAAVSSLVVNKPAGAVTGDVLLAVLAVGTSTAAITPPAGWTALGMDGTHSNASAPGTAFYKVVQAGEASSYTFTGPTGTWDGAIVAYSGCDNLNPILKSRRTTGTSNSSTALYGNPNPLSAIGDKSATRVVKLSTAAGWVSNGNTKVIQGRVMVSDAAWATPSAGNGGNYSIQTSTNSAPLTDLIVGLNADALPCYLGAGATASGSAVSTLSPVLPSEVAPGSLLFLWIGEDLSGGSARTVTVPAGWTKVLSSADNYVHLYYRIADATDAIAPTAPVVTFSGTTNPRAVVVAYSNPKASGPVEASTVYFSSTGTARPFSSLTTTAYVRQIVGFIYQQASIAGTNASLSARLRETGGSSNLGVEDVTGGYLGVGSSPAYTRAESSGTKTYVATLSLVAANVAPFAPTLTAPASSAILDRALVQRFSWTINDDVGDVQTAFDLQYRIVGAGSWTTVSQTTANSYYDFAASALAAGNYEWQVRTTDSSSVVGAWSASEFFTAADAPATPTITAPAAGATIPATQTFVWTASQQDAYEVRRLADASGSPDTGTVYSTTGTVVDAVDRDVDLTFPSNSRYEHLQVRVRYNTLWSAWASVRVFVNYVRPIVPNIAVTDDDATATNTVTWSQPAPSGGSPTVTSVDVFRNDGTGEVRVVAGGDPADTWTDWTPASGVTYTYRVLAYGNNGTTNTTAATA